MSFYFYLFLFYFVCLLQEFTAEMTLKNVFIIYWIWKKPAVYLFYLCAWCDGSIRVELIFKKSLKNVSNI